MQKRRHVEKLFRIAPQRRRKLPLIHADICGPMEVNSLSGARYFLLFKNNYSGYRKVYFLKTKEETADQFKNFIKRIRLETGEKINTLRTDNELEFIKSKMKKIMIESNIKLPFHVRLNKTVRQKRKTEL